MKVICSVSVKVREFREYFKHTFNVDYHVHVNDRKNGYVSFMSNKFNFWKKETYTYGHLLWVFIILDVRCL